MKATTKAWIGGWLGELCLGCAAELPLEVAVHPPAATAAPATGPPPAASAPPWAVASTPPTGRVGAVTPPATDRDAGRIRPDPTAPPYAQLTRSDPRRCPPEMMLVGDHLCVDRWEGSLRRVMADGTERRHSPFGTLPAGPLRLRAASAAGVIPQGYLSGQQAQQACRNAGKRLCSAAEWTRACRGPRDWDFPYGPQRIVGSCNDDGRSVHPVVEAARRAGLPPDRMWYEGMDNPLINQLEHTVQKTGARVGCTNRYGAYDMVGNLHEWIDDPEGTFRGGYFMDTWRNGDGCNYETVAHPFSYHDYSTGFRCCMAADPVE